eukprot:COSAG01_NODE_51695_length_352_cov_4.418972_1_plen_58_part_10
MAQQRPIHSCENTAQKREALGVADHSHVNIVHDPQLRVFDSAINVWQHVEKVVAHVPR